MVCGYADIVKPAVNDMDKVKIIVEQCTKLEKASGVKLHRNPQSGKCKLLPMGKWISKLNQNMVMYDFIKLTDMLDVMGVKLSAKYQLTRAKNSDIITEKVKKITNMWCAGRFMALMERAHAINSNVLSTVWFRASSIPLRQTNINSINKAVKSWILQDQFNCKISNQIMYRGIEDSSLGLFHVKSSAEAHLLCSFLETAP